MSEWRLTPVGATAQQVDSLYLLVGLGERFWWWLRFVVAVCGRVRNMVKARVVLLRSG